MKRLTISRARELIKRELGLSVSTLTAPCDMNQNPNYPWYEMTSGNMKVEVCTTRADHVTHCELIVLSATHENSSFGVTEYFYLDTMEYAPEYTEMKQREVISEIMCEEDDPTLKRLGKDASDALWQHHFDSKKVELVASPAENMKSNQETLNPPVTTKKQPFFNDSHSVTVYQSPDGKHCALQRQDNFGIPDESTGMEGKRYTLPEGFSNRPEETGNSILQYDDDPDQEVFIDNDKNGDPAIHMVYKDSGESYKDIIPLQEYKEAERSHPEQQHPPFSDRDSLQNKLSRAQQSINNETHKPSAKSRVQCIE
jgi:hypothetical protein